MLENSLRVLTLNGKIETFTNINFDWNIGYLKVYIYKNHPSLIKPFPDDEIHKLLLNLVYNGISLSDDLLIKDIILDNEQENTLFFSITNKNNYQDKCSLFNEYSISPYSEQQDIFMDSFEFQSDRNYNKEIDILLHN